jgi:glyoxylase-like metal-dependent hydrolase (beta-lactamase superfamily II)
MDAFICITCGTQYPPSNDAPAHCPICEDDRQYVNANGQQWTTPAGLQRTHRNSFTPLTPGLTTIRTEPGFAISQHAYLIQTPAGNLLWECISLLDNATIARVRELGGVAAISISHPHFYSSMIDWSLAFDAPIYLHADNRPWIVRPHEQVRLWVGEQHEIMPGLTVVRCGGHFPGSSALHWSAGADGRGALFTGDTIMVVSDLRYVSFMYSYPNLIPLNPAAVQRIVASVEPYAFDRIYSSWSDKVVSADAKGALRRSAERYIAHLQD